jgi:hypothetical protein
VYLVPILGSCVLAPTVSFCLHAETKCVQACANSTLEMKNEFK